MTPREKPTSYLTEEKGSPWESWYKVRRYKEELRVWGKGRKLERVTLYQSATKRVNRGNVRVEGRSDFQDLSQSPRQVCSFFCFYLPSNLTLTLWLFTSLGGMIMMIYWGELQSYHVVWIGKNDADVEQELWEIGRSKWIHSSPNKISLVPRAIGVCWIYPPPPPFNRHPIGCVRRQVNGYHKTFGAMVLFNNPQKNNIEILRARW